MINNVGGPAIILALLYVLWPLFVIWASVAAVNALRRIAVATEALANEKLPPEKKRNFEREKSDPAYKYVPK